MKDSMLATALFMLAPVALLFIGVAWVIRALGA